MRTTPPDMRRALLPMTLVVLAAVAPAAAQDGDPAPPPPVVPAPEAAADGASTSAPEAIAFGASLEAARTEAREQGKPLLVVAVPDWYESPAWARVEKDVLPAADTSAPLLGFVRVLVRETRDREVHVRHRVPFEGYPLAVVLSSEGVYLGHTSGLPAAEGASWAQQVAAIPARAARIAELRSRLDTAPENADVLYELGVALAEAGESERADALFERMEQADPLAPPERLGEARYHRLRHRVVDLLTERKFGDVEGLCLRWQRRFAAHARAPDVLLLQANAHMLAGEKPEARAIWQRLVDDHADAPAAAVAKRSLAALKD